MNLMEKIGKEILFFDGAMGTELQKAGLRPGEIPESWNIIKPEIVFNIHKSYLDAGAQILKTNTFGANALKFENTPFKLDEVIHKGIEIAQKAVAQKNEAYVALDISSLGKLLQPCGDLAFDKAYEYFSEIVTIGNRDKPDFALIETMSDIYETKAAVLAVKENSSLPIFVTMTFDNEGKLLTGSDIASVVCTLEGLGIDAIGFNCGLGPEQMIKLLPQLKNITSLPIIVNPNAGLPVSVNGKTKYNVSPEQFAEKMVEIVNAGASLIGGCCGTTPTHIEKMIEFCKDLKPQAIIKKNLTVCSSFSKTVDFTKRPVLIGERLNPTGKASLKQALRTNDIEYLQREAITQSDRGADILDVNVGLPEINEYTMMEKAITSIQSICSTPLQIDTSNIEAMERAMRIYNGKAIINSVNGKEETMKKIFPLAKKYGALIVSLTLDEKGIPNTAQERIDIAIKIIETAKKYGIEKKDIIIDPLAMTISTDTNNANISLDILDYVKNKLHVHCIMGVSNISFGLPQRELINSTFFAMALTKGLSAGIINPCNDLMMNTFDSFLALNNLDKSCENYITHHSNKIPNNAIAEKDKSTFTDLYDSIVHGLKEQSYKSTKELLQQIKPMDIIEQKLIPALNEVGTKFENKIIYLPQLLQSADAAKSAFEAIKEYFAKSGEKRQSKCKIVIATVKGDVHDIGKNIVKVLLENFNYEVIDLGKDVDPSNIVEIVKKEKIPFVALSALMTTTVANMEETIKLLRQNCCCKILVGGAVLTEDYAKQIGADFYSKDAMGAVKYLNANS